MRRKSKQIDISKAVDLYYSRHKAELKRLWKSERSAKSHLKNGTPNLPASHFSSYKQAAKVFGDYVEETMDPASASLKRAKRDAINASMWGDQRSLNGKMNKLGLTQSGKYLGTNSKGIDQELIEYYDVKNTGYVLAHINEKPTMHTEYDHWEYIDRSLV